MSARLLAAATALLADIRARYPGEELRCPLMQELDDAVTEASTTADYDTINDLDEAISELLGYDPWMSDKSASRTMLLDRAMAAAFRKKEPEGRATAILRKAWNDLERTGAFQPKVRWDRLAS